MKTFFACLGLFISLPFCSFSQSFFEGRSHYVLLDSTPEFILENNDKAMRVLLSGDAASLTESSEAIFIQSSIEDEMNTISSILKSDNSNIVIVHHNNEETNQSIGLNFFYNNISSTCDFVIMNLFHENQFTGSFIFFYNDEHEDFSIPKWILPADMEKPYAPPIPPPDKERGWAPPPPPMSGPVNFDPEQFEKMETALMPLNEEIITLILEHKGKELRRRFENAPKQVDLTAELLLVQEVLDGDLRYRPVLTKDGKGIFSVSNYFRPGFDEEQILVIKVEFNSTQEKIRSLVFHYAHDQRHVTYPEGKELKEKELEQLPPPPPPPPPPPSMRPPTK